MSNILRMLSPWSIQQLTTENERLRRELGAATEKYAADLEKLHSAIGQTPDVSGGFVEACCAEIRRLRQMEAER